MTCDKCGKETDDLTETWQDLYEHYKNGVEECKARAIADSETCDFDSPLYKVAEWCEDCFEDWLSG